MPRTEQTPASWSIPQSQITDLHPVQIDSVQNAAVRDQKLYTNDPKGHYFPTELRSKIKEVALVNNVSPLFITMRLQELQISKPRLITETRKSRLDRTLYFGCIHGGSPQLIARLNNLAEGHSKNLPDRIILGGDLAGAEKQHTIRQKQLFYDYLMNRAGPLLSVNPSISKDDLLNASGDLPPTDSPTIRDGAIKLLKFTLKEMGGYDLSNQYEDAAMKRLMLQQMNLDPFESPNQLDMDEMLNGYIRWIRSNNLNSGTWVGTLPRKIRQYYMDQYQTTAEALAKPLLELKKKEVDIVWIEGNEDTSESLAAISHGLERVFDTQAFLGEKGLSCVRNISGKEGKASYHILVSYDEILKYDGLDAKNLCRLQNEVNKARAAGKVVVIVAHGQIDWKRHNPGKEAIGYNLKIINNLRTLLWFFKPDELIHPHQHAEMPNLPDKNAKFTVEKTVVSYLPLNAEAVLELPIWAKRERRQGIIFSGEKIIGPRQPVRRI